MMHPASRGGKGNLLIFRSRCANFFLPVVIEITLWGFGMPEHRLMYEP